MDMELQTIDSASGSPENNSKPENPFTKNLKKKPLSYFDPHDIGIGIF